MPWAVRKPCTTPGCAGFQPCAVHARPPRSRIDKRSNTTARGYGADWSSVRKQALKRDRFACPCGERAVLVHHIKPITGPQDPLRLDLDNCVSMCRDCHERLHGRRK